MAANRDERMKEITDRLQAGLEELFNSEKYAEYLRVMSQFHHYSFNNTLLIAMQKPDATLVAGYHAWNKKFNRHVMKGEKGIQIIAPAPIREKQEQEKVDPNTGEVVLGDNGQPETEEVTITIPRFKVSTVFDLSQTDGDPLPELGVEELTASVENYDIFMEAIRSVAPVPIRFDEITSGAKGYYSSAEKEIVIQSGMGEMQTMKTAVHETAHAILHDKDIMQEQGIQKDQQTREVEAESVAFATLAHFELDTSEYSFPYIAGWSSGRDTKELKSSLDTIRRTASEIIDGIEASMREQLLERQEQITEKAQDIDVPGREDLLKAEFQEVTLYDVPMLYSNGRVDHTALPEGLYCYDLRGSDYDPGEPIRIEEQVAVNHAATVISAFPVDVSELGSLRLGEELNFEGGEITLSEYITAAKELDPVVQAERMENAIGRANEELYLDGKEERFAIYQLREGEEYHDLRFMNTEYLAERDLAVEGDNYNYIYGGRLPEGETLDGIYERFNLRHPEGYEGHSMSVSDVVVLHQNHEDKAYYVDSMGFKEIPFEQGEPYVPGWDKGQQKSMQYMAGIASPGGSKAAVATDKGYFTIQQDGKDYDYTFYDKDFKEYHSGSLVDSGMSLTEAIKHVMWHSGETISNEAVVYGDIASKIDEKHKALESRSSETAVSERIADQLPQQSRRESVLRSLRDKQQKINAEFGFDRHGHKIDQKRSEQIL